MNKQILKIAIFTVICININCFMPHSFQTATLINKNEIQISYDAFAEGLSNPDDIIYSPAIRVKYGLSSRLNFGLGYRVSILRKSGSNYLYANGGEVNLKIMLKKEEVSIQPFMQYYHFENDYFFSKHLFAVGGKLFLTKKINKKIYFTFTPSIHATIMPNSELNKNDPEDSFLTKLDFYPYAFIATNFNFYFPLGQKGFAIIPEIGFSFSFRYYSLSAGIGFNFPIINNKKQITKE